MVTTCDARSGATSKLAGADMLKKGNGFKKPEKAEKSAGRRPVRPPLAPGQNPKPILAVVPELVEIPKAEVVVRDEGRHPSSAAETSPMDRLLSVMTVTEL